jgi:hypothetical protein
MQVRLLGQYGQKAGLPQELRGKTFSIGIITAGVSLTEDGLTLNITNQKLAEGIKELLGEVKDDRRRVRRGNGKAAA